MLTWTALLAIIRAQIGETATAVTDATLLNAMNGALLAVYGDLVVVCEPATITMVTGTKEYDVPDHFLYIEGIRDSSGARLPDYAWEIWAGVAGGTTEPKLHFRSPFFTPTTGSNPTVTGWQAKTVEPAAGDVRANYTAVIAIAGDSVHIEPGWLISACLSALHSGHGGTASDLSDWHKLEAAESRLDQKAERRLKDELMPTIPPKYRPTPGSRIVPGRAE